NGLFDIGTGTLTLGSHLRIDGTAGSISGGSQAFDNQATIIADPTILVTSPGTFSLSGTHWVNHGTIQADHGATIPAGGTLANFSGGTLTGGTWKVLGNSTLRLLNGKITTNAAALVIDGANSHVYSDNGTTNALDGLAANTTGGSFSIQNGFNLATAG